MTAFIAHPLNPYDFSFLYFCFKRAKQMPTLQKKHHLFPLTTRIGNIEQIVFHTLDFVLNNQRNIYNIL